MAVLCRPKVCVFVAVRVKLDVAPKGDDSLMWTKFEFQFTSESKDLRGFHCKLAHILSLLYAHSVV
jgi:hypothetical protein